MLWDKLSAAATEWNSVQLPAKKDSDLEELTTQEFSPTIGSVTSIESNWTLWEDIDLSLWAFSYEWSYAQWMFHGKSLNECRYRWLELCEKALEMRVDVRTMLVKQATVKQGCNQDLSLAIAAVWFYSRTLRA